MAITLTTLSRLTGFGVINIDVYRDAAALAVGYGDMRRLLDERWLEAGDKYSCRDATEFDLFRDIFERREGVSTINSPGGSIFNSFCAVGASQCGIQPRLVSYIGNGQAAPLIRETCIGNGVDLAEIVVPDGFTGPASIPRNLVVQPPEGGERILIKGPSEAVKAAFDAYGMPDHEIDRCDGLFVQGASVMRFGMGVLDAAERQLARRPDRLIVFSLPTVRRYEPEFHAAWRGNMSRVDVIRHFAVHHAAVLSSTREEFTALFGDDVGQAAARLRDAWAECPSRAGQVRLALVTDGAKGALLIQENQTPQEIPARQGIVAAHKVGAGDAALGGFLVALKAGLPPVGASAVAMDYGAIKAAQTSKTSVIEQPLRQLAALDRRNVPFVQSVVRGHLNAGRLQAGLT